MAENITTTHKSREKFAEAHAHGNPVPAITEVGWGDGGVDVNGDVIMPTDDMSEVPGEFLRNEVKNVEQPYENDELRVWLLTRLDADEDNVVGEELSSCGLYDDAGDLIAIRNFSVKGMDEDTVIEIEWVEEF